MASASPVRSSAALVVLLVQKHYDVLARTYLAPVPRRLLLMSENGVAFGGTVTSCRFVDAGASGFDDTPWSRPARRLRDPGQAFVFLDDRR